MKISEYATMHANDGKKIKVEKTLSATSLVGEIICIQDFARIAKTKFGKAAYLIQIDDESAFWTSDVMTKQLDRFESDGVDMQSLKGCRFLVTKNHFDEFTDKQGNLHPACDPIMLEFVEEASE